MPGFSTSSPPAPSPAPRSATLRLFLARHRRICAAGFAAATVGFALVVLRPPPPPTVRVPAAARDLPAGTVLRARDVRMVAMPVPLVPDGVARGRKVTGRMLSGPMRRGEPLTDARLLQPGLLKGYGHDMVATPVRLTDAGVTRLLRPGDRVDVLLVDGVPGAEAATGADAGGNGSPAGVPDELAADLPDGLAGEAAEAPPLWAAGPDRTIASRVSVITVPRPRPEAVTEEGALVVLATDRLQAAALATARGRLTITIVG